MVEVLVTLVVSLFALILFAPEGLAHVIRAIRGK